MDYIIEENHYNAKYNYNKKSRMRLKNQSAFDAPRVANRKNRRITLGQDKGTSDTEE